MKAVLSVLAAVGLVFSVAPSAVADGDADVDLHLIKVEDVSPGGSTSVEPSAGGEGGGVVYSLESRCKIGETCTRAERICPTADGEVGTWYLVVETNLDTGESEHVGIQCLARDEAPPPRRQITPAMVRREFERLAWPTSDLQLQPPDGQTLINFDTNFFTDNTAPTTRTVTLLGQRVEIEAMPTAYTWEFGDGTSRTTSSPGAAYPDLDVTHEYEAAGRVSPSVATTYQGRYRINGGGWQQIPGSLTLDGEPESLRVRSASPRLVGTSY